MGGAGFFQVGVVAYLLVTGLALITPAAIAVQVVGGVLLLARFLVVATGSASLLVVPAVAGIIFTAELLAIVARMDTPFLSDPRDDLPRAIFSALIGGGVLAGVLLLSGIRGPSGPLAILLASGACVLLAFLMIKDWGSAEGGEGR